MSRTPSVGRKETLIRLVPCGGLESDRFGVGSKKARHDAEKGKSKMSMTTVRAVIPGAIGLLLSMSITAQGSVASDQPAFATESHMEPTMMRIVPYADEMYAPPSCYRIGRCSAYDLYRFRDRPNRLTRLAPEAPPQIVRPPTIEYQWILVPVTPEENILPRYRTASQVRDEYRAVGRSIEETSIDPVWRWRDTERIAK